jgi:AP-2 complex subunit alpha
MRALQYFPTIEDPNTRRSLFEVYSDSSSIGISLIFLKFSATLFFLSHVKVLQRILMGTDVVKNVNKNNAAHAVLFEALALVSFPDHYFPCFRFSLPVWITI